MTIHELNELEIDEISLVDQGANEGAEVVLMKRDMRSSSEAVAQSDASSSSEAVAQEKSGEEEAIEKRLAAVEIEKAALEERMVLQSLMQQAQALWPNLAGSLETKARVLKAVDALAPDDAAPVLAFFKAADAALGDQLIEKGVTQTADDMLLSDEEQLHALATHFAAQHNLSLPIAKKRLVSENKEAAALFKRVLARVQKR